PRPDLEWSLKKQFEAGVPRAEVPGFRAGKAPRQFVENKFRKQVADQVKGSLLMDSLAQISEGDHFSAISEPDLAYDKVDIPDDGPMTYEFNIEVRPEFDLPSWKGISIEKPDRTISDEELSHRLDYLRTRNSALVPIEEAAQADDTVVCRVTGRLADKVVAEADDVAFSVLPTVTFHDARLEGFDQLMIGAKAGDKRHGKVAISEFSENPALQGQKVDVEFEVLEVKRFERLDDEGVKEKYGVDSIGEIKDLIRDSLQKQLEYDQRQAVWNQISRLLTESATWELPPDLLRRQFRRELNRAVMELRSSGYSDEEIQIRENSLRQDILRRTEMLLKEHFILERIAEQEKIEDAPEDYDVEIAKIAMSSGDSPRRVRARLERQGQMDVLRNLIIERKVIELIESQAQVKPTSTPGFSRVKEAAVNFAFGGRSEGDIPEAKYEEAAPAPIPGTVVPGSAQNKS
ncbi:MAG: trigger factor, partial [Planctomycetota bacterium]